MQTPPVAFKKKWLTYLVTVLVIPVSCAFLGLLVTTHATSHENIFPILVWFGVCSMSAGIIAEIFSLLAVLSEEGISYLTWRGRRFLVWHDVTTFRILPPVMILHATTQQVVLSLLYYHEPSTVITYILDKIPAAADVQSLGAPPTQE